MIGQCFWCGETRDVTPVSAKSRGIKTFEKIWVCKSHSDMTLEKALGSVRS